MIKFKDKEPSDNVGVLVVNTPIDRESKAIDDIGGILTYTVIVSDQEGLNDTRDVSAQKEISRLLTIFHLDQNLCWRFERLHSSVLPRIL